MYLCTIMMHDDDTSASGYLKDVFEGISQTFTDIEILNISEVNVVAKAKRYGRWWLLKGLQKDVAGETAYQQRLRKELEILMQLQHPHVVATYGIEDVEGLGRCLVMEYVDGPTLKEWLNENPSRELRLKVAHEIIDALTYIHAKGVVHRDLKPENIIVTGNGDNVKLIDFGLADTDSHAILKQPAGTPRYMSPEQMQTAVADVRNDIYSIGVILQQMKLGLKYRHVINRCMLSIDRRYRNALELQNAIRSTDQLLKRGFALMGGLLVVALLLLIGMQVQRATEQEERMEKIQASYQQEQEAQQQQMKQLTDSMTELRTYNQQLREREVTMKARRQQVKDAIYQGKALIDKTMQQTRIDQHLDTLSNIIYIWGDFSYKSQSGLRAIETYLEHINPSFDDTERDEIRNALNRHNEAIVTKWQNRIVNLYK